MPLTELWLSNVSTSRLSCSNRYDSATSRQAAVAFAVKMAAYSFGSALKWARTAALARSIRSVDALDAGFSECGLPKHWSVSRSLCARYCAAAARQAPV